MCLRVGRRPKGDRLKPCVSLFVTVVHRLAAVFMALIGGFALAAPVAHAIEVEFATRPIKREILALYDSRHEAAPQKTRIHLFAEMPLNWLGYKVTYRDVNGPLPPVAEMSRYRGLLTWFIEPMTAVETYLPWLDRVTAAGTRFAFLSEMVPNEPPDLVGVRRLASSPASVWRAPISLSPSRITRASRCTMPRWSASSGRSTRRCRISGYLTPIPGKATVHLAATAPMRDGWLDAALVTTNPAGGYASDEYTLFHEPSLERDLWILNPFPFFKKAFGDERFPVPDVTTLMGRRMYFSHIDGDGWNNVSEIEGYRDAQVFSADVIRREVIEPYPDLPVSVGVIAGDAIPELGGTDAGRAIARKIYALPQVEVASHTYSHPFNWSFFENYDRAAENEADREGRAAQPSR